jgi:hypothetical protein
VLTEVELIFVEGREERWLRFGRPVGERVLDRRRRIACFAPGAVFALVRWRGDDHGTMDSRLDVLRAVAAGEPFTRSPFVAPGGELLARLHGWSKVERALRAIDTVEAAGVAPSEAAPDYWRHVGNRLTAGFEPRAYDRRRHEAWLLRRTLVR